MSTLQLSLQVGGQLALTDFHLHDLSEFSHMALPLLTVAEGVHRKAGAVHSPTVQCMSVFWPRTAVIEVGVHYASA